MTTLLASASRKMPRVGKRRICFPITSRAYYGRCQLLIKKLHAHPDLELELMLGGSILLDKYSRHIADDIEAGGFAIVASLFNVIEGGNHVAMAKTACLTALEFTNGLHAQDPDIVVICGDRFEQLAIAMAAAYLNKTLAHIEGLPVDAKLAYACRIDEETAFWDARLLGISAHTVSRHLSNMASKVGVHGRVALTRYALEHHLVYDET